MEHQRNFGIKYITVNSCRNKLFCETFLEYTVQNRCAAYLVALLLRLKKKCMSKYKKLEYMHSFKE